MKRGSAPPKFQTEYVFSTNRSRADRYRWRTYLPAAVTLLFGHLLLLIVAFSKGPPTPAWWWALVELVPLGTALAIYRIPPMLDLRIGDDGIRCRVHGRWSFHSYRTIERLRRFADGTTIQFTDGKTMFVRDGVERNAIVTAESGTKGEAAFAELTRRMADFDAAESALDPHTLARLKPRAERFRTTLESWRRGDYRDAAPSEDEATAVLANPAAPSPLRARAAALLAGSEGGQARVRVQATTADEKLAPILVRIAAAADDEAIAAIVESEDSPHEESTR